METKARKRIFNAIMVVLIGVIIFSGVMITGNLKGWFADRESSFISADSISGICSIERGGIGYTLKPEMVLGTADVVETEKGGKAGLKLFSSNRASLNSEAELKIESVEADSLLLDVTRGEVFFDVPEAPKDFKITYGKNTATVTGTVFSISVQQGSSSLCVYDGSVSVTAEDGSENTVEKGKFLSVAESGGGKLFVGVSDMQINSLNAFMIGCLKGSENDRLFFDRRALSKLEEDRAAERSARASGAAPVQAGDSDTSGDGDTDTESSEPGSSPTGGSGGSGETHNQPGSPGSSDPGSSDPGSSQPEHKCTITILCNTILDNMGNLTPGKEQFVPSNGVILGTSEVGFNEGETVFDVLTRVCDNTGIQIEYSWTPMYGSYYIEGINNLYEFDCGHESGWMYKVNGWFPNYGCSSYKLNNGDDIVWCYTCNGLGADVGGSVY